MLADLLTNNSYLSLVWNKEPLGNQPALCAYVGVLMFVLNYGNICKVKMLIEVMISRTKDI